MKNIFAFFALTICTHVVFASDEAILSRSFQVIGASDKADILLKNEDDIKDYLRNGWNVEWPKGASLKYLRAPQQLLIRNTQENIRRITLFLHADHLVPFQIDTQMYMIQFDLNDIDALAREGRLNPDALLALWKDRKAALLYAPRILMVNGNAGTVQLATTPVLSSHTNTLPASTNTTHMSDAIKTMSSKSYAKPGETGLLVSLQAEGNVLQNTITISFRCEIIDLVEGLNKKVKVDAIRNDSFLPAAIHHTMFHTEFVEVVNGKITLLGGGMNNSPGNKLIFVFATSRILDMNGIVVDGITEGAIGANPGGQRGHVPTSDSAEKVPVPLGPTLDN